MGKILNVRASKNRTKHWKDAKVKKRKAIWNEYVRSR